MPSRYAVMPSTYTAFFYGTLLHPSILRRVIGHHGEDLKICPALLIEHTRHQIQYADYPGVIPYAKSRLLLTVFHDKELSPEERTVRGTLVSGLSESDIKLLDIFEGNEYSREVVSVHPLRSFASLSSADTPDSAIVPLEAPSVPDLSSLLPPISAQTYIWCRPISELKPALWSYADFVRDNAWKWVGDGSRNNADYIEVDRRREMNGSIVRTEIVDKPGEDSSSGDIEMTKV